jgi:hypothetical protein
MVYLGRPQVNLLKRRSIGWLGSIGLIAVGAILGVVVHALALKVSIKPDAVEAGAAVALAFFAVAQIVVERQRAVERRADIARDTRLRTEAAEQRVSFLAHDLRRKILSWHRPGHPPVSDVFLWAYSVRSHLGAYFDPAEDRIDEISKLAPRLGDRRQAAATQTVVLFLHSTNQINRYLAEDGSAEGVADNAGTITGLMDLVSILDRELISEEMSSAQIAIEARQEDAARGIFGAPESEHPDDTR